MSLLVKTLNWAGNQFQNIYQINEKINFKSKYNKVVDGFLGGGSLLLNLNAVGKKYIGFDIMNLSPEFLNSIIDNNEKITKNDFLEVIEKNENFKHKDFYYNFKDEWNELFQIPYLERNKKEFIIKTIILLKLCSNSIVRFNSKGIFNQGFRGLGKIKKEKGIFFLPHTIDKIFFEYEKLEKKLIKNKYNFHTGDFLEEIEKYGKNDLLILDPPYKDLEKVYAKKGMWNDEKEKKLLDFLLNKYEGDFILFTYLNKENTNQAKKKNFNIVKFMNSYKDLKIFNMNEHLSMGQNRIGIGKVKQIILTNIKS